MLLNNQLREHFPQLYEAKYAGGGETAGGEGGGVGDGGEGDCERRW